MSYLHDVGVCRGQKRFPRLQQLVVDFIIGIDMICPTRLQPLSMCCYKAFAMENADERSEGTKQ
jgi:hypothetical protein